MNQRIQGLHRNYNIAVVANPSHLEAVGPVVQASCLCLSFLFTLMVSSIHPLKRG